MWRRWPGIRFTRKWDSGAQLLQSAVAAGRVELPPNGMKRLIDIGEPTHPQRIAIRTPSVHMPWNCPQHQHDIAASMGDNGSGSLLNVLSGHTLVQFRTVHRSQTLPVAARTVVFVGHLESRWLPLAQI